MARSLDPRASPRHSATIPFLAALGLVGLVSACVGPAPGTPLPVASSLVPPLVPSSPVADHLGSIGLGGRLDAPAIFMAGRAETRGYTFDVTGPGGRLRVSVDLSNRDDCVDLRLWDPGGGEVAAMPYDRPIVCPSSGQSGQVFDIELSVPEAAAGRWRALVTGTDVIELSQRMRVSLTDTLTTASGSPRAAMTYLYPDLVPWLPWEFGFVAPASDQPGTTHDRGNEPGDPTVSCHPTEEPGDRQCLRFSAGVYNIGAGPMYVGFRDDTAYQHVYEGDATPLSFADNEGGRRFIERPAGSGEWHEFHSHRHLADFVLYELFELTDPSGTLEPVETGHKHGYCTFSQQIADWDSTAQDPQYASFPGGAFCDDAMTLERGWGDIYRWQRPGQYVSYASVADADGSMRAGRYVLRFTVDPEDHIAEMDETNNVGYALIDIVDGGGLGRDSVVVCAQGLGGDPWAASAVAVPDRFAWARRAADPGYATPRCD